MLKKIFINQKEIPVPVPLKNMADLIQWVEDTLLRKNSIITKVSLHGDDVLDYNAKQRKALSLDESSLIHFQFDSPDDLAVQTLDVIRDLSFEMVKRFRALAVKCWELDGETHLRELSDIIDDLGLVLDLVSHVNGMLDYSHADMAPVNGLSRLISRSLSDLKQARKSCDWKQCAKLLLNRFESYLKELVVETENLQLRLFSTGVLDLELKQNKRMSK